MEIVYLLVLLLSLVSAGYLLFVGFYALTGRVKKDAKKMIIRNSICNTNSKCMHCNGNCDKFTDQVLSGERDVDDCPRISCENKEEIKALLNSGNKISDQKVAHVFCRGGKYATNQHQYVGATGCEYSNQLFEGLKTCRFACQGCLDCANVCPTGAIRRNPNGVAEVDRSLCIGCGACVQACPDELIELIDLNQKISISCKQARNQNSGNDVREFCAVGCTKCGACVAICPTGAIYEENGLIKYDNSKCNKCERCVNVCPNSTIILIKSDFLNF